MNTNQRHIIDKVRVKVKTNSMENGLRLKDNVGEWIKSQILPYIENYIAGLENNLGEKIIQFDQLKISLDIQSGRFYVDQIPEHILKEMDLQLKPLLEAVKSGSMATDQKIEGISIHPGEREMAIFFHFLFHGKAPWYTSNAQLTELLSEGNLQKLITEKKIEFYKVFFEFLQKPVVQSRMIRQLSDQFLYQLIHEAFVFVDGKTSTGLHAKVLHAFANRFSQVQKEQFWQAIFLLLVKYQSQKMISSEAMAEIFKLAASFFATEKNQPSQTMQKELVNWLEELIQIKITTKEKEQFFTETIKNAFESRENGSVEKTTNVEKDLQEPQIIEPAYPEESRQNEEELKKGIVVENAGLILTHPFLKHFLKKVELINDNNEINDPFLVVHILHYIATGKQQDWDHNLLFEKFLCNVPLITSIPRNIVIPAHILSEIDELLKAMLQNWTILSNSSPDLLRAEFLQRPGKLILDEYSINLTIERKTQDILLDKLPWNISIVKLPWHKNLIYTTW